MISNDYPTRSPVVVTPQTMFTNGPMQVTCGNCRRLILTSVVRKNGACTCLATIVACCICFPFFWVPLCMDSYKDVHHSCPGCGIRLGTFKKI